MSAETDHPLARAVLEALLADERALDQIRRLVPIDKRGDGKYPPPAYTAGGLAAALGVSSKVVRNAIARGERRAVKRGGRWYVTTDAVEQWTHREEQFRAARAPRPASSRTIRAAVARLEAP